MLKVGDGYVMRIASQTISDQTDMIGADFHSFMRETFSVNVSRLQVHHLKIEDASNYNKKKEIHQCLQRVIP